MLVVLRAGETPTAPVGVTQTALLSADQLVPGAILAGEGASQVWVVERADPAANQLWLAKLGDPATHPTGNPVRITYVDDGHQGVLPYQGNVARPKMHVLLPVGPLLPIEPLTIYGINAGDHITSVMPVNGQWESRAMPIIPSLFKLWSLPPAVRAMLRGE